MRSIDLTWQPLKNKSGKMMRCNHLMFRKAKNKSGGWESICGVRGHTLPGKDIINTLPRCEKCRTNKVLR